MLPGVRPCRKPLLGFMNLFASLLLPPPSSVTYSCAEQQVHTRRLHLLSALHFKPVTNSGEDFRNGQKGGNGEIYLPSKGRCRV